MSENQTTAPAAVGGIGARAMTASFTRRTALGVMATVAGGMLVPWSAMSAAAVDSSGAQSRELYFRALPDSHHGQPGVHEGEEIRLQIALCNTNLQSTGFYLPANTPLQIQVQELTAPNATLVVGAPDSDARPEFKKPREYALSAGKNTITDAGGGVLYFKVIGDAGHVRAVITGDAQRMPYFIHGRTGESQFQTQLDEWLTPYVEFVSAHAIVTVERASALKFRTEDHAALMDTFEDIIAIEDATSGYDGSAPEHARQAHPYHFVGFPNAITGVGAYATHGHMSFPPPIQDRLLTVEGVRMRGWGLYHELGHQHQQMVYKPTSLTEVTVNVYSLAVNAAFAVKYGQMPRLFTPDAKTGVTPWDSAIPKIGTPGAVYGKTFDAYERLVMFEQLRLGFPGFWPRLHKMVRTERPWKGDWADEAYRLRMLVIWFSKAAGADLSEYFLKWGFVVDDEARAQIAAAGLTPPSFDPSEIRDDAQRDLAERLQS
ncbi:M60 family metallopeptidase [Microbacterium sp.]|uniref:M60 family metallopeptidase n=1 Tax=Microbacterium sp. TaxID=51671 RepID=UPI0028114595|nr:M60 family metallopeptidase [Microbacterium sp.]